MLTSSLGDAQVVTLVNSTNTSKNNNFMMILKDELPFSLSKSLFNISEDTSLNALNNIKYFLFLNDRA